MKSAGTNAFSVRRAARLALLLGSIAAASACGGGSSSSLSSTPAVPSGSHEQSRALLTITIPAVAPASATRRRDYVSDATASGSFSYPGNAAPQTFALTPGSPGCTTTANATSCKVTVNAPVGANELLTVSLFDKNGKLLSTVTTTATIAAGQTTPLVFTLNGVVSAISLAFNPMSLTQGQSGSAAIVLNALDADGSTIIAPGGYADASGNPLTISLADSDTSGATALSKNSVTAPTSGLTLSYNGSGSISSLTVTASASGLASQKATLNFTAATGCPAVSGAQPPTLVSVGQSGPQVQRYAPGSSASAYSADLSTVLGPAFGIALDGAGTTYLEVQETLILVCPSSTSSQVQSYLPLQADGEIALLGSDTIAAAQPDSFYTKDTDAIAFYGIDQFKPYADQRLDADPVSSASPAPSSEISGSSTKLNAPFGLALDASGQTYVGNNSNVTVYAAGARGNVAPARTISLPNAGLAQPLDVGADGAGNVYVLYALDGRPGGSGMGAVAEYAAGSSGAAPIHVITGSNTKLGTVTALAVDPAGDVFVAAEAGAADVDDIYKFAPGANGNVAPAKTFAPMFYSEFASVTSLAASSTILYSLNEGDEIEQFGPGNAVSSYFPEVNDDGAGYAPSSIRTDAAGNLYGQATGDFGSTPMGIIEFPPNPPLDPNGNGGAVPAKIIGNEGNPFAVSPSGTVYVAHTALLTTQQQAHSNALFGNYTAPDATTSVDVFASGSTTSTGSLTGPFYSTGFISDAAEHLFDIGITNVVDQFSETASGTQAPQAIYSDVVASTLSATPLSYDSNGVALDASGNLYVASTLTNSIAIFPPGASTPSRSIIGPKTLLYHPQGMTIDAAGNLYVASVGAGILVFGPSANGNVAPSFVDTSGAYFLAIGPASRTASAMLRERAAASPYGARLGFAPPEHSQLTPGAYFARLRQGNVQR
jgi:hypothetical protein